MNAGRPRNKFKLRPDTDEVLKDILEVIQLDTEAGLTALCAEAGISKNLLGNVANGRSGTIFLSSAIKIAEVLGYEIKLVSGATGKVYKRRAVPAAPSEPRSRRDWT